MTTGSLGASLVSSCTPMNMSKRYDKWLSWIVASALLTLTLGLGCGSAADLDAKDCCKSMCQHDGNSKDPEKCCQQSKQSKPAVKAHLADLDLSKKVFDFVFLVTHPLDSCLHGVLFKESTAPPPKILKFPQQEVYQLTSAFLI